MQILKMRYQCFNNIVYYNFLYYLQVHVQHDPDTLFVENPKGLSHKGQDPSQIFESLVWAPIYAILVY